jgi:hypothetical protein
MAKMFVGYGPMLFHMGKFDFRTEEFFAVTAESKDEADSWYNGGYEELDNYREGFYLYVDNRNFSVVGVKPFVCVREVRKRKGWLQSRFASPHSANVMSEFSQVQFFRIIFHRKFGDGWEIEYGIVT